MIYLRSETDSVGDVVDYNWYCCESCYRESFQSDSQQGLEQGGAYPCGSEHDGPDFCATCGDAIGNPLTPDGLVYLCELVADWRGDPDVRESLQRAYGLELELCGADRKSVV